MRLIDADALLQKLGKLSVPTTSEFFMVAQCVRKVNDAPTVDIKTEVANEIFAEIEFDIANLDFDREETRAIAIEGVIAKAKNKYIKDGVTNG